MGLIKDDLRGGLQKGGNRLKAAPHGGGNRVEQPARLSPAGYASGSGGGQFVDQAPYKQPVFKPAHASLEGRAAALLRRGSFLQYLDPQNKQLFAQVGAPPIRAGRQYKQQMKAWGAGETPDKPSLAPVSPSFRAHSDKFGPKPDIGAIVAAQAPTQVQLAGLAGGSASGTIAAMSRSWPARWAQQGALEMQNSLPGLMYAGQTGLKKWQQTHNPGLAVGAALEPMVSGMANQYGKLLHDPLGELNRNPFDTTAALLPLGSMAARAGEGAVAARATLASSEAPGILGPQRAAAQAFLGAGRAAQNTPRFLATPNEGATQALYGRSAGSRLISRVHDRLTGMGAPWAAEIHTANKGKLNQMYREAGLHEPSDFHIDGQVTPPETQSRAEVASALLEHHAGQQQLTPFGKTLTPYADHRIRSEAQQNEAGYRAIETVAAEKAAAEAGKELPRQTHLPNKFARGMDVLNASGRLGQLYVKPSYLWANLLGQGGLTAAQQGIHAGATSTRAVVLHRAMRNTAGGRETLDIIHRSLAGGQNRGGITGSVLNNQELKGLSKGEQAILGLEKGVATSYGKVLDDPWRFNSFIHEAGRQGYKTPQALYTLTHDPTLRADFTMIQRRANRAMIDYARMGKTEREGLRRAAYFYPWVKGATMYGAQALTDHPALMAATAELGREGTAETQRRLGDPEIPSFMQGAFISGSRKIAGLGSQPKGRNLQAASIFGTPAGVAQAIFGGGQGAVGQTLSDYPAPALTWMQRFLFHYDPATGRKISEPTDAPSSFMEATKGLLQGTFPYRLGWDLPKKASRTDQTDLLYPISKGDIAGFTQGKGLERGLKDFLGSYAFAGPASSRPINEYARRRSFRSEVTGGLADKSERDKLSVGKWLPEDLVRETNKLRSQHGLPPLSVEQQLGLHHLVEQKLQLKLVYDGFKVPGGGRMKPVDRLQALMEYAAEKQGKEVAPEVKQLLLKLRSPDAPAIVRTQTIPKLVKALEQGLFPQKNVPNKLGKPLKLAGARVTIPK